MEQESISMEVVNPQAAGIDVGSRSHWVAVGAVRKGFAGVWGLQSGSVCFGRLVGREKCQNCSDGKHRHLPAKSLCCFDFKRVPCCALQREVYQKHQGEEKRCDGLSVDTETAYPRSTIRQLPA